MHNVNGVFSTSIILSDIVSRLRAVRALQLKTNLQHSLLLFGTIILLSATAILLLESIGNFSRIIRTVLVLLFIASSTFLFIRFILVPLLRLAGIIPSFTLEQVAARVGHFYPHIRDHLLNMLQLHREVESGTSPYSPELLDASFREIHEEASGADFLRVVDRSPLKRSGRWFAVVLAGVLLLLAGLSAPLSGAAERLVFFMREYIPPTRYVFEISPGDAEVVKGDSVEIRVRVNAVEAQPIPWQKLRLHARPEGQSRFDELPLESSESHYRARIEGIRSSTEYLVELEESRSALYRLNVIDRPVLRTLQIRLEFPAYTKLPPRLQEEFVGDVTALAGTRISLSGSASKPLKNATVKFGNGLTQQLTTRSEKFSGSFSLSAETTYSIEVHDAEGLTNPDPIAYRLEIIPDEFPSLTILRPGRNIDLAGDRELPLLLQARDDYGFSSMRLAYRLIHSRYEQAAETFTYVPIPFPPSGGTQLEVPFVWDLRRLSLVPEDVVEYFAEVSDNDIISGPKSARTPSFLLRLPSLEEVFTDLNRAHERSIEDLDRSLEEARKLKETLDAVNEDMKKNKEFDWQQQKRLEEMARRYEELQKKLDEAKTRVDEMVQKMQEQNVLSAETLEKYLELQQLFEQLNSAELQQLMKQMQQAMQNVDRQRLQEALRQLSFSEERFRQSIERTINLLKRLQVEQKVDEVKKRAQELERLERELAEQSAEARDAQQLRDLARQQDDLARPQERLEAAAEELHRRMEEFFTEMPADQLQKMIEDLKRQELGGKMQQAAEQLRSGQPQRAQMLQQQIRQHLQQFAEQMDQLQQQMLQQQAQYIMNEMRRAISNLLELSQREEALKQQSQSAPPNSPQLRQNAQDQLRVMQDLANVIGGLGELSQRSFAITPEMGRSIGEALSRMQNAMRALELRSGAQASGEQGAAMAALNKAAMQVQNALQQMMQGGGGMGSLMQQLQMMAGQQMGINMQTQGLPQGSMSMEQAAQAARLAVEQEAVRKSLEQLNREAQASGERERILGDLGRIAEEMREVVRDLEQQNVNPQTLRTQERILSRLLDASKSMRERDYERRRQARPGTRVARQSPAELDPSLLDGSSQLRDDLLRSLQYGYSKDYQELIRRYFEQLQKVQRNPE